MPLKPTQLLPLLEMMTRLMVEPGSLGHTTTNVRVIRPTNRFQPSHPGFESSCFIKRLCGYPRTACGSLGKARTRLCVGSSGPQSIATRSVAPLHLARSVTVDPVASSPSRKLLLCPSHRRADSTQASPSDHPCRLSPLRNPSASQSY